MPHASPDLHDLPSPFYRVTAKAIILDSQHRLLIVQNDDGEYELPGGGWEHNESLEACLNRELREELGVEPVHISPPRFMYRGISAHGWHTLRLTFSVRLNAMPEKAGPDMAAIRFVTRAELQQVAFALGEEEITQFADHIFD